MHPAAKPLVFVLCLLPFAWLFYGALTDGLGANPAEHLIRSTGDWTLRFICIVLAVTPLRVITKAQRAGALSPDAGPVRLLLCRRAPAELQLVRHGLRRSPTSPRTSPSGRSSWSGFSAFVLLTPLAATSFNRAIKALGAKRWQALHKLVYVIAGLGLLHFFWMRAGKNNFAEVFVYAAIIAVLLGWRVWNYASKRKLASRRLRAQLTKCGQRAALSR